MEKKGQIIFMVGAPQTGKTTMIKKMIKNIDKDSIGAVDLNDEFDVKIKTFDFEELLDLALTTKNKTFIFEEATSYFSHNSPQKAKALLSRAMGHLKHNIIFSFHSLRSVPSQLLPYITSMYYTRTIEKNGVPYPLDQVKEQYKWYDREFFYM